MRVSAAGGAVRPPAGAPAGGGRRGAWMLFALAGLGAHALLLSGAAASWPVPVRVMLAGFVLVLLPGYAFVRLGLTPPGGALFTPGWALGFGVAWNAALVLLARLAGQPVTGLDRVALVATAALWAMALWLRPRGEGAKPGRGPRAGRSATITVLLAAAFAALYVGRLGTSETLQTDSPDHIGTIRRIMTSGDAFPTDAFFKDAGPSGADPRKGVWHPQVAVVARLAAADPADAWRWLSTLLAPLYVLNVAALGLLAGGGAGAGIAAWVLLLTYGGTIAQTPLRQAVLSSRLAEQLVFAATAAVLADLARPAVRWRLAAVLLGFAAVTTHLFAVVHLAVPLGALGLALLIRDRGTGPEFRRLFMTSLALAAGALPFLLWRAQQAYAPRNVIHTAPQGLLYLKGGWEIMSPGFLWTTFAWTWVLIPLLWVPLWRRGRGEPVALWMLSSTVAAALLTLNPLFVAMLEPRVGYLIWRFIGFVPMAVLIAWALPRAWRAAWRGPLRLWGAMAVGVIAVTLIPAVRDAFSVVPHASGSARADQQRSAEHWSDALVWMRAHLPDDAVILSDPETSYSIPMMTGRYVVTLVDQHSSPNDSLALDRLLDARDALDAWSPWSRVREVLDRWGANVIVLNDRFPERPRLDYWGPTHFWFAAARARFDAHPAAFENVFDTGDFVIYEVRRAALDSLDTPPARRPFVNAWRAGAYPPGTALDPDMPELLGVNIADTVLEPGDTLAATALWHARASLPAGSYLVAVRLDRPLPPGFRPPAFVGKPWRKLLEKLRGERYRLRSNHVPVGGAYGVDEWRPTEVVRDSFRMVIPQDAAPGTYTLGLRMLRVPHYPNYHVSDWFFDHDLFSGAPSGTVRVGTEPQP